MPPKYLKTCENNVFLGTYYVLTALRPCLAQAAAHNPIESLRIAAGLWCNLGGNSFHARYVIGNEVVKHWDRLALAKLSSGLFALEQVANGTMNFTVAMTISTRSVNFVGTTPNCRSNQGTARRGRRA